MQLLCLCKLHVDRNVERHGNLFPDKSQRGHEVRHACRARKILSSVAAWVGNPFQLGFSFVKKRQTSQLNGEIDLDQECRCVTNLISSCFLAESRRSSSDRKLIHKSTANPVLSKNKTRPVAHSNKTCIQRQASEPKDPCFKRIVALN